MAPRERREISRFSRGLVFAGGVAGVLGAILMGLAASAYVASNGGGWSTPMQAVAGTFYKAMAFVGGPGVTTIGVLTHLSVGGVFGVLFAVLTRRINSRAALFFLGIAYGIGVWACMTYITLPIFDWVMLPRVEMMGVMWFFLHWIYGACTGLFLPGLRGRRAIIADTGNAPQIRQVA